MRGGPFFFARLKAAILIELCLVLPLIILTQSRVLPVGTSVVSMVGLRYYESTIALFTTKAFALINFVTEMHYKKLILRFRSFLVL